METSAVYDRFTAPPSRNFSTDTVPDCAGATTCCSRTRANVFDRSVSIARTYLNAGESSDWWPFGSCGLFTFRWYAWVAVTLFSST